MLTALLVSAVLAPLALDFDYRSGGGFFASLQGIPVLQGSFFQYYEDGWTKGYYSSNWNDQSVLQGKDGQQVSFVSTDRLASGDLVYSRSGDDIVVRRTFRWDGPKPVKIEDTIAMIWAPVFAGGTVQVDGGRSISLAKPPQAGADFDARRIATGKRWVFEGPLAKMEIDTSGGEVHLIDGRGSTSDWAQGKDMFWLGFQGVDVAKGKPAELSFTLRFTARLPEPAPPQTLELPKAELEQAVGPFQAPLPVIPQPKSWLPRAGAVAYPDLQRIESPPGRAWFAEALRLEFARRHATEGASLGSRPSEARIRARIGQGPRGAESYAIEVGAGEITITAQDEAGLRHAARTLAQMATANRDGLGILQGRLEDWPSTSWRGIHMFVGPRALAFQTKLMQELLAPLRFNQVVLECGRTDWKATPGIATGITMSRDDLAKLFAEYRKNGIEPSPLIQSFGHMGWLFANGQNKDLMFNPEVPFSIDPRKPRTREMLEAIWDEAIALLKPKMVHFGLDEVDMRGWPDDPKLVTELWQMHIPWLAGLAKGHNVDMMLWGDKCLAPGEAPDATHGHTAADAKARRDVIPDGAWIGDWHYRDDPRAEIFTSLELWKREGQRPVAATWFRPDNVYGFFRAAQKAGVGVLHTTWAGYESTERNMMVAADQFESYVLAGEYAWSGRDERPGKLPYRPEDVLRRWYFDPPRPLRALPGWSFGGSTGKTIGDIAFRLFQPISLYWPLSALGATAPKEVTAPLGVVAREVALAMSVQAKGSDGEEVGEVVIRMKDGTSHTEKLHYGWHVRTADEDRNPLLSARSDGLCAVRVRLAGKGEIESVTLRATTPAHGLRLHGVTAF